MDAQLRQPLSLDASDVPLEARLRLPLAIAALAVPVLCGLAVMISGFGLAWDFLNYHYYDAYALFVDRSRDIAPAGLHSFFNPTAEIPFYLGARTLPMPLFGFLFGFVSGLNFPLLFFLARRLLQGPNVSVLAFLCAVFGCSSTNFAIELASVNHDNLVSLFFLAGLYPLLQAATSRRALVLMAMGGLLMGLGVGVKLTLAPFLAAGGAFLPLLYRGRMPARRMLTGMGVFALAALAGVLVTSAWWMLHLWATYGNPLFPMFNAIFKSPYAAAASYADHRFLPQGVLQQIAFPLFFSADFHKAGVALPVHDFRYLAAYAGTIVAAVLLLVRRGRPVQGERLMQPNTAWFLIAVAVASYVLWQMAFGVSRYLLPFDLLLPLVALAWLQLLGWTSPRAQIAWGAAFALLALTANHPWHGQAAWTDKLMAVKAPAIPDGAMVVMAGTAPLSYLIPGFPPHVSFVRVSLSDGFTPLASGGITAVNSPALLAKEARHAIATHSGALYVLFSHIRKKEASEGRIVTSTLDRLRLRVVPGSCAPVLPTLHYVDQTYALCRLQRA